MSSQRGSHLIGMIVDNFRCLNGNIENLFLAMTLRGLSRSRGVEDCTRGSCTARMDSDSTRHLRAMSCIMPVH